MKQYEERKPALGGFTAMSRGKLSSKKPGHAPLVLSWGHGWDFPLENWMDFKDASCSPCLNSPDGNSGLVGDNCLPPGAASESCPETARKWGWCPGFSHLEVVYFISLFLFLLFYLCLMVINLLQKFALSTCPESQEPLWALDVSEQSLIYFHWPL